MAYVHPHGRFLLAMPHKNPFKPHGLAVGGEDRLQDGEIGWAYVLEVGPDAAKDGRDWAKPESVVVFTRGSEIKFRADRDEVRVLIDAAQCVGHVEDPEGAPKEFIIGAVGEKAGALVAPDGTVLD